jgi:polyisoprenoid-binding protein YceI
MSWKIDLDHSTIQFSGRHMIVTTVRGRFDKFTANLEFDEQHPERTTVDVQIEAASLSSNYVERDNHLRSPDFLDVAQYPYITFKSKRVELVGSDRARLSGDLTIKGVTREVSLNVEHLGQYKSPWNTVSAGFSAQTKINRKDWGLTWNMALETGGLLVSEEITLTIELEVVKQVEPVLETVPA